MALQLDPIKLRSDKFNIIINIINITIGIIINIINITFRSDVAVRFKALGSNFANRPNALES
jgi:hypothetical protein